MKPRRLAGYFASLPERLLRSLAALAGGAAHELGVIVLPARVRRSRLYQSLVGATVRLLIEQLGQVEGAFPKSEQLPDDFVMRIAAGNVIGIAGLAAFRFSPIWVLAALADLAGAGRDLINEIAIALEKAGLLAPGRRFDTVDQLLDGLESTSGELAETVNTPPLDVASLRLEWAKLRSAAARLPGVRFPSPERLWKQWGELQQEAESQGRSVLELSSAMALTTLRQLPANALWLSNATLTSVRRAGAVLGLGLLDHYRTTLKEIHHTGYLRYWLSEFSPYFRGALRQFSPERLSATERLFRRSKARKPEPPSEHPVAE
jgi:hypothetical protein